MQQIWRMLDNLKINHGDNIKGMILHSNQGFQNQLRPYYRKLIEMEITQSMSRKGNCLKKSPTENFFGILKQSIIDYIEYYNNERIVTKLKVSPNNYRESFYNVL